MTGFRRFVIGCVLSAASVVTLAAPAQTMPLAVPNAHQTSDVHNVRDRGLYGGVYGGVYGGSGVYGGYGGYRPYQPYGYRPYVPVRPYYAYRPYYRPYVRPGVNVYVTPRPVYRSRYDAPGDGTHAGWCLQRYRSYNPTTNRFLSYSGVYTVCRSPYR